MLNVYSAVKKYDLGTPFVEAAAELALNPESSRMNQGEYSMVEVGTKYVYPPVIIQFTTELKVLVLAGEDFALFKHSENQYVFWRTIALRNNPDEPMIA